MAFWVGLYVVTFGLLLWYRVLTPIRVSGRHRLRVAAVVPEARGVVSLYLTGRDLDQLPVAAGQFFHIRFLRRGGWWRPHPFSISAAPNGQYLRMTIKDLGDDSHRMMTMPVGTPVFIEGPYGAFTPRVIKRDHVVMLAGGVGVTPLRAIFEALPAGRHRITFLYREGDPSETVFRAELLTLARRHGAVLRFLEGHRGSPQMPVDPLAPEWLYRHAPHIAAADVLVCGSPSFTQRVLDSLKTLRVPDDQSTLNASGTEMTAEPREPSRLPVRGTIATVGTVGALALLLSFRGGPLAPGEPVEAQLAEAPATDELIAGAQTDTSGAEAIVEPLTATGDAVRIRWGDVQVAVTAPAATSSRS